MILKIYEKKSKKWLFYDKIDKVINISPGDKVFELVMYDEDVLGNDDYYKRKDGSRVYIKQGDQFIDDVDRICVDLDNTKLNHKDHYYVGKLIIDLIIRGESSDKSFIYDGESTRIYLLNDEGKTIESIR